MSRFRKCTNPLENSSTIYVTLYEQTMIYFIEQNRLRDLYDLTNHISQKYHITIKWERDMCMPTCQHTY